MRRFLTLTLCLFSLVMLGQEQQSIKSLKFEQLDSAFAKAEKPAIIFLTTPWCKYCRAMEQNTFTDAAISRLIRKNFHFVPFDAESREPIVYRGVRFSYQASGKNTGVHQLAVELARTNTTGIPEFPMLVIINKNMEILFQKAGFMDARELEQSLQTLLKSLNISDD